jgi:hypothetical protein
VSASNLTYLARVESDNLISDQVLGAGMEFTAAVMHTHFIIKIYIFTLLITFSAILLYLEAVLYMFLPEALGSNLGYCSGSINRGLVWIFSFLPGYCQYNISFKQQQCPSRSFQIHYSPVILQV